MNGIHDMGGMQDMGPIQREHDEPIFHAEWERRIFALFNAVPDVSGPYHRHQIELIPPADYLRMSYYERWVTALTQILIKTRMATAAEIESGKAVEEGTKAHHVLTAAQVASWAAPHTRRKLTAVAHFKAGQRVRAREMNPVGHTRLPRYVRGKVGTIERNAGVEELQDSDIEGLGPKQQPVYTVRFAARELWGEQASPRDSVYVAMWEGYLDSA
jgi:nitrile hydratase